MPKRVCDVCEQAYLAKRPTSKYCSARCRMRATRRRRSGGAPDLEPAPKPSSAKKSAPPAAAPDEKSSPASLPDVVRTTRAELVTANALDTALGQAALTLAHRIDYNGPDTASALASLTKEWRATLAEATKNKATADNPLEKLRKQRERRGA